MTHNDDDETGAMPATSGGGLPVAEAIGTKRLMAAIIVMPIIAVAATLGIIVYAKTRPKPAPPAASDIVSGAPLRLPAGGRIAETLSDGRHLIVRIEGPLGGEIAVFDIATGERVRTIPIETP